MCNCKHCENFDSAHKGARKEVASEKLGRAQEKFSIAMMGLVREFEEESGRIIEYVKIKLAE